MKAEIRDDRGARLNAGETGELWVWGPNVMKGYYRNPAATAEVLQDGWLRTGDIGYFDHENYCYLKGRSKEMVIVGGHNVYPAEVETVLLEHPLIRDAAVAAETDDVRGERLLGFVVTTGTEDIEQLALAAFCRERLSPYKIPRAFYAIRSIPRNAAGKIVRRELINQLHAAADDCARSPLGV
jgi:acyl-CoA synthetase (AMP-forming)/AMP-acid ligase II